LARLNKIRIGSERRYHRRVIDRLGLRLRIDWPRRIVVIRPVLIVVIIRPVYIRLGDGRYGPWGKWPRRKWTVRGVVIRRPNRVREGAVIGWPYWTRKGAVIGRPNRTRKGPVISWPYRTRKGPIIRRPDWITYGCVIGGPNRMRDGAVI
jgi:hypothetical protein